jgi:predicted RNase H-like HicB family nuclease
VIATFLYPGTFKRDEDGGFVATFKDIPEAIAQGKTEPEALAAAKETLWGRGLDMRTVWRRTAG